MKTKLSNEELLRIQASQLQVQENFYIYLSCIFQARIFEPFVPVITTKPKVQNARARAATEIGRLYRQVKLDFTKKEWEVMEDASAGFGLAIQCLIRNPIVTAKILDELLVELQKAESNGKENKTV